MTATTPDWLTQHGGELKPRVGGQTWSTGPTFAVLLNGSPQYVLTVVPITGKFGCQVMQTNNGQRLDSGANHPTADAALQGGLDDLRKALGW